MKGMGERSAVMEGEIPTETCDKFPFSLLTEVGPIRWTVPVVHEFDESREDIATSRRQMADNSDFGTITMPMRQATLLFSYHYRCCFCAT